MTAPYAILHFLVDGVCAYAMFGHFSTMDNWYRNVLLYNFCAFAMQMPLGAVLDILNKPGRQSGKDLSFVFAIAGVLLTFLGAVTHPVILGLGNALFHLGGGVGTIYEDEAKGWHGKGLGVFVAPGALGLYLGTLLGKGGMLSWIPIGLLAGVVAVFCLVWCYKKRIMQEIPAFEMAVPTIDGEAAGLLNGCLAVVILRSYIGMAVSFSWKNTLFTGTIAVLAVVLGKVAGGFVAAWAGIGRTVAVSLLLSGFCFLLSENMAAGVLALFLFNMTMPITLYLLVKKRRGQEGFSFGVLTFGLFLGFLPTYLGLEIPMDGRLLGCVGSFLSLLVLLWIVKNKRFSLSI